MAAQIHNNTLITPTVPGIFYPRISYKSFRGKYFNLIIMLKPPRTIMSTNCTVESNNKKID